MKYFANGSGLWRYYGSIDEWVNLIYFSGTYPEFYPSY